MAARSPPGVPGDEDAVAEVLAREGSRGLIGQTVKRLLPDRVQPD